MRNGKNDKAMWLLWPYLIGYFLVVYFMILGISTALGAEADPFLKQQNCQVYSTGAVVCDGIVQPSIQPVIKNGNGKKFLRALSVGLKTWGDGMAGVKTVHCTSHVESNGDITTECR